MTHSVHNFAYVSFQVFHTGDHYDLVSYLINFIKILFYSSESREILLVIATY